MTGRSDAGIVVNVKNEDRPLIRWSNEPDDAFREPTPTEAHLIDLYLVTRQDASAAQNLAAERLRQFNTAKDQRDAALARAQQAEAKLANAGQALACMQEAEIAHETEIDRLRAELAEARADAEHNAWASRNNERLYRTADAKVQAVEALRDTMATSPLEAVRAYAADLTRALTAVLSEPEDGPASVLDTEGGRSFLAQLLRNDPTPLTVEVVRRVLADTGSRYTLDEIAAELGVDFSEPEDGGQQ